MTKRNNGPQQIGSLITDDLLGRIEQMREQSQRRRIEGEARPGESWDEAAARLRKEQAAPSSNVRRAYPRIGWLIHRAACLRGWRGSGKRVCPSRSICATWWH